MGRQTVPLITAFQLKWMWGNANPNWFIRLTYFNYTYYGLIHLPPWVPPLV